MIDMSDVPKFLAAAIAVVLIVLCLWAMHYEDNDQL